MLPLPTLAAALLAPAALAGALLAPSEDDPAQKAPVAGLRGVTAVSRVVFEGQPDLPQRLEAAYVFPDRARLWLDLGEGSFARTAEYRLGSRFWTLAPQVQASLEHARVDAENRFRQLELRRAVLLFPDGFDWEERDGVHRAALTLGERGEVGRLTASSGASAGTRPTVFEVRDPSGAVQETLHVLSWQTRDGRTWPERMRLVYDGRTVWTETVQTIDARLRYLDSFFVPVDRREAKPAAASQLVVRRTELDLHRVRRFALPAETSWDGAWKAGRERLAAERERLGEDRPLEDDLRFEIDAGGRPTRVLLALAESAPGVPGYTPLEGRSALYVVLGSPRELRSPVVDALLGEIPEGAAPRPAYVRRVGGGERETIQVVLPLVPAE